jgi:hypothetical protein
MIALAKMIIRMFSDLFGLAVFSLCSRDSLAVENLFLRRQLALFKDRSQAHAEATAGPAARRSTMVDVFEDPVAISGPNILSRVLTLPEYHFLCSTQ